MQKNVELAQSALLEQAVLHAVAPQAYGLQFVVVAVPQAPLLQNLWFVCVDPVHDCAPQETVFATFPQTPTLPGMLQA